MGIAETEASDNVLNALAPLQVKVFRVQAGSWWACTAPGGKLYRMQGAREGVADYCGWRSIIITPEMVGRKMAQFVAIECKSKTGKAREAQLRFGEAVRRDGGIAGVCRDATEAEALFRETP